MTSPPRRVEETRLPKGQEARYAHAEVIGADGYRLLEALRRDPAASRLWQVPAVELLRRVWLFQFYVDGVRARWRTAGGPGAGRAADQHALRRGGDLRQRAEHHMGRVQGPHD